MKVRYNPFFVKLDGVNEANADGTLRRVLLEDSVVGDEVLFTLVKHPEAPSSVSVALTFHEQIGWMPPEAARRMAPIIERYGTEIYEGRILGIALPKAKAKAGMNPETAECKIEVWQSKPVRMEELIETLKTKKKSSRKKRPAKTAQAAVKTTAKAETKVKAKAKATAKSVKPAKTTEKNKARGTPARKKATKRG